MKHLLYTFMAIAIMAIGNQALAEGQKQEGRQSAAPYSEMEPAAGDPTRVSPLSMRSIEMIQQELNTRGYSSGPVDGIIGPRTKEALRQFQEDNNLPVTGAVTNDTLTKLGMKVKDQNRDKSMMEKNTSGSY